MGPKCRSFLCFALAFISLALMPQAAMAALTCNGSGGVAGGDLYDRGAACAISGPQNIFGTVLCTFVNILDNVLDKVYCGMQFGMQTFMGALLTMYVAIFGAQLLMGYAQLNAGEIIIRLLKVAGVWTFVTQSSWGIGVAFTFFIAFITEGTYWVVSSILPAAASGGATDIMPVYAYIDQLIYTAIVGPFTQANDKLIGFFFVVSYTIPPIFMMAAYWLWSTFILLARTLISFMLGVSAIAFLITLSPIFLSFMLFKLTFNLFESWLRYMISFSLQIIVIFAIVTLWIMITSLFIDFFNQLANVVFFWNGLPDFGSVTHADKSVGICPYNFSFSTYGPTLSCNTGGFDPNANPQDHKDIIKPSEFAQCKDLVYFIFYNLTTLVLVAFAFNNLLKNAPAIAKDLVGPDQAPALGGGWGNYAVGTVRGMPNTSGRFGGRHSLANSATSRRIAAMGKTEGAAGFAEDMVRRVNEQMSRSRENRPIK